MKHIGRGGHGHQGGNHQGGHQKKSLLDPNFDHEKEYFYQELSPNEIQEISNYVEGYLTLEDPTPNELKNFFKKHPNLKRGSDNLAKLQTIINSAFQKNSDTINISAYKLLSDFVLQEYYTPKPVIQDCFFFPGKENEVKVLNFLRKPKRTLDIAIFTLTNDYIYAAIEETFKRGVRIRVIADDECMNQFGSDICKLASIGIPVKTDNSVKYHMHHKFAIADNSIVFTGSFNWTAQAVFNNQENVIIIENKEIAEKYTEEYERLWREFKTEVSIEEGLKLLELQKAGNK